MIFAAYEVLHLVKLSQAMAGKPEHEADSARTAQVLCSPDFTWHTVCPGYHNTI